MAHQTSALKFKQIENEKNNFESNFYRIQNESKILEVKQNESLEKTHNLENVILQF